MPRRHLVVRPDATRPRDVPPSMTVAVVGGGIAGCTAATVLAERGAAVTLYEAESRLGGRAAEGHGFHAFFRQYHNLRAVLGRVGARLRVLPDYPVVSPFWPTESFARLPRRPPWNLLWLVARSASFRLRDLAAMDGKAATPLLAYDRGPTYERFDAVPAADVLDSLRMPHRARSMLFDVFSHSFFNREAEMSAAEMIQMFHFYFLGNPEGLLFDVPDGTYETAIWLPWRRYLENLGVDVRPSTRVDSAALGATATVVATDVTALPALIGRDVPAAPPYAVSRFSIKRDLNRAEFAGVSGAVALDSISLLPRGILELHAYAAGREPGLEATLLADLHRVYPETVGLPVAHSEWRYAADCSGFPPGSDAARPGVDSGIADVYLAGDYVKLPFPSALMERSAASGVMAANAILHRAGAQAEPVWSIPPRGLLANT